MVNQDRLVELFMDLVTIDSETRNEREMADRLKKELSELGFEVEEDNAGEKIDGNAGNVIGTLKGNADAPSLMLSAHMDRVSPGNGVEPVLEDGVISSKGETILAADDIAGVAAILEAIKIIKEEDAKHGELKILFTVAEEGGLNGSKNVDPKIIKADYGVCYDSSGDVGTIVVQGPAQYRFNAVIKGKAAHAGVAPSDGVNAIKATSLGISEMKLGQIDEETTANIGVIKGGQATNIVPDRVELEGEARSRNRDSLEEQVAHMKDILEKACKQVGAEAEIETELMYPSFNFDGDHVLVKMAEKAAQAIGIETELVPSGGGSDANIINGYGIPTINLGIGMENVHSVDEYISVDNLVNTAKYTVSMIKTTAE